MAKPGKGKKAAGPDTGTGGREILLAEDRENDIELLTRAFEKAGSPLPVRVVRDGQEAIDYLKNCGGRIPAILLLDLKMPRMSGFEVMEWVRQHPQFRQMVVVVFSVSDTPDDIRRAYLLGANSYLLKPVGFPELVEKVRILSDYWLKMNVRPGQ